jgi:PadR family transcriptional regulator, regulatory protein PadR
MRRPTPARRDAHMKLRKELIGATTHSLILSILADGENHGYEIVRKVNDLSEGVFEWREGTVYPVLHKMEQAGLIDGQWVTGSTGKQRRVYKLTDAGRRALKDQKKEWAVFSKAVNRILEVAHA